MGIGVTEIIRSIRQSQFAFRVRRVFFTVSPAVALAGGGAAVGSLRITALHHEVGAGNCSVQHHVIVRHGEFHGVLVAVDVVALAEEPAVQAEDFSVGGDGHFLRRGCGHLDHNNVGGPIRRHIVDSHDLGFGGGRIPSDVVDSVAVEYAAKDLFAAAVYHRTLKGAADDRCAVAVCYTARALEGSTTDYSVAVVYHGSIEDTVALDGAFVCHCSIEGAFLDEAVVCHCFIRGEGAAIDRSAAVVFHLVREDAVVDYFVVYHFSIEGAFLDGTAVRHEFFKGAALDFSVGFVCHFSLKGAARNRSVVVFHFSFKGAIDDVAVVYHTAPVLEGTTADSVVVCHTAPVLEGTTADGAVVCHFSREGAFLDGTAVRHEFFKGAALDFSVGFVCHFSLKGAARNRSVVVFHFSFKGAIDDVAVVYHTAPVLEGTTADSVVVCHTAPVLEGTTADGAVVCHDSLKGAVAHDGAVACHFSLKGAVAHDGAVVCHTARVLEGTTADGAVVFHFSRTTACEDAAGNFRPRLNLNLAPHSLIGRLSCLGFGIGVAEIIRSTRQSQCLGDVIIAPVTATGADRETALHDEVLVGVCCEGPQGEHGEHHAQC